MIQSLTFDFILNSVFLPMTLSFVLINCCDNYEFGLTTLSLKCTQKKNSNFPLLSKDRAVSARVKRIKFFRLENRRPFVGKVKWYVFTFPDAYRKTLGSRKLFIIIK